jgi:hypothetical protein
MVLGTRRARHLAAARSPIIVSGHQGLAIGKVQLILDFASWILNWAMPQSKIQNRKSKIGRGLHP